MTTPTFTQFLATSRKYTDLIIALCAEETVISHSKLLNYLERHGIEAEEKTNLIDNLRKNKILHEANNDYTVNNIVVDLVNYYERRGRLTNASFLKKQIDEISQLTDQLQQQLFAEDKDKETILDQMDALYRLVREVREAGESHYVACMLLFGNLKRASDTKRVEQRLQELETIQRRHINPLRELIDPNDSYVNRITLLKRRLNDLEALPELLAQSQELRNLQQRLNLDMNYIDHILLKNFEIIISTALRQLQSLIDEKNIKDALAGCLGNLDAVWEAIESDQKTVLGVRQQTVQAPSPLSLTSFFSEVIHRNLLPNPTPIELVDIRPKYIDDVLIRNENLWQCIKKEREIISWPTFVLEQFGNYPTLELLRAITLPLIIAKPQIRLTPSHNPWSHQFYKLKVKLNDFGVVWTQVNEA